MEIDSPLLERLLDGWPVARLATVTPGGDPHALPVVFVRLTGGCLGVPVDGKRKRGSPARLRNVETHGRACLLLDSYRDDWDALWWVKLTGAAWVERGAPARARAEPALRQKYPQYGARLAPFVGEPTLLVLRPERVTAWTQAGDLAPLRRALAAVQPPE